MTTRAADKIFLRGLEVECIIGFIDWERRVKQRIQIDLELPVDCTRAARSDDVGIRQRRWNLLAMMMQWRWSRLKRKQALVGKMSAN